MPEGRRARGNPGRLRLIGAVLRDGRAWASAGHGLEANPYAWPHPDEALRLIWVMAWVDAGGWELAARRGEPVTPDALDAAMGSGLSDPPGWPAGSESAKFHASMAARAAKGGNAANPYRRDRPDQLSLWAVWSVAFARASANLADDCPADELTHRQREILRARHHARMAARAGLPMRVNPFPADDVIRVIWDLAWLHDAPGWRVTWPGAPACDRWQHRTRRQR